MRGLKFIHDILLGKVEISNACKNWKKKMIGKDIEWTTFLQVLKKMKKIKVRWFQTKIFFIECLWETHFWRSWEWLRTMYAIFAWQKKTHFFTLCVSVNTPSPFGSGLRCVLIAQDFQLITHSFFSDMTEKRTTRAGFDFKLFACTIICVLM